MYNDNEFELTQDERAQLASLPREMPPGDLLEGKVIRALRREGYLGTAYRESRSIGTAWKIAAALALFAGGVATGRYLLASDTPASASISAPSPLNRDVQDSTPRAGKRSVPSETIVAEREMWLC